MSRHRAKFEGKTALVTGGASGIGRALVAELVASGARVTALDKDAPGLEALAREHDGKITTAVADVRDRKAVERVVREIGQLDYAFNNAGVTVVGEVIDLELGDWAEVMDTNLAGVINCVTAEYPVMVAQGSGHIVNTASLSGLLPTPFGVPYAASKFGVVGLSLSLRLEGVPHGVNVSAVCPAMVDTPIVNTCIVRGLDRTRIAEAMPGKPMPAAKCAELILKGVVKNQAMIMPGLAGAVSVLNRFLPSIGDRMSASIMSKLAALKPAPPRPSQRPAESR